ncbi:hypothetical protein RND81_13G184200 [Saponaria officinalis]|uniref:Phosphatidic acid phosphatase type 2/haloperoxidase domain-containing protein n=1 Tax=Saponaria officinalis TaxID=3572 RepID=A0AAW1H6A6_SAPOF
MLAANLLTNSSISSFPTKFNLPTNSLSFSSSLSLHHRCSSQSSYLFRKLFSGKPNFSQKLGFMGERVFKIPALGSGDTDENIRVFEQESLVDGSSRIQSPSLFSDFESTLNSLSKWLVAATFGTVILWRHDPEAVWVVMGSVLNSVLSVVLKQILNQERPVSNRRSDPGMPSSHAQSIFFAFVFVALSMVEWLGVNEFTLIFAALSLAVGSYFSWLRVAQRLHTISQVVVGAIIGSCFALLWVWSWDAFVCDAFSSVLWVRVSILLGSAICCLGFLIYVVLNWFSHE